MLWQAGNKLVSKYCQRINSQQCISYQVLPHSTDKIVRYINT